ncbi:MAG TPA: hypothetical protein PKJ77_04740 [Thermodesulfobacteriota bacterium]|nr:hypothetical protein [Deltaproteobacteria bacterium]HNU71525.1 hypothetical protein [Thermodesulfobacteriota bacterium]HOC38561.1 hypothetical protein [Thermodesulfobacteriota bacterium]
MDFAALEARPKDFFLYKEDSAPRAGFEMTTLRRRNRRKSTMAKRQQ